MSCSHECRVRGRRLSRSAKIAEGTEVSEQTTTTNQPAQGWYTDPHDAERLRWWDGNTWTDHVHSANGNDSPASGNGNGATAAAAERSSGIVVGSAPSKPAKGSGSGSGGGGSAVSEWLAVRSNQVLLLVLIIAFALFAFVMLGGGA